MSNEQYNLIVEKIDQVNASLQISNNFFYFFIAITIGILVCFLLWKAIDNFLGF